MQARINMGCIGKLIRSVLICVNFAVCIGLLACANAFYIDPIAHPTWSVIQLFFPFFLIGAFLFLIFWLFVKWRYMLFSLIAMLCCWGAIQTYIPFHPISKEPSKDAIKILSYNTRGFNNYQPHTKENPNKVLQYLQVCNADIICLQECVFNGKLKKGDVDKALKDYPYQHFYKFGKTNGLGCYSRYPILSAIPIEYKSSNNGSIAYTLLVQGDTVLVVNNHLESNKISEQDRELYKDMLKDPERKKVKSGSKLLIHKLANASAIRAVQAHSIAKAIAENNRKYIIVCGDFNDSPLSYAHRVIGTGLNDAFAEAGTGFGFTYNRKGFDFRIDHILVSPYYKVYKCVVDRSTDDSDHYPVWCYIAKEK